MNHFTPLVADRRPPCQQALRELDFAIMFETSKILNKLTQHVCANAGILPSVTCRSLRGCFPRNDELFN
jgi:hypothetical protein